MALFMFAAVAAAALRLVMILPRRVTLLTCCRRTPKHRFPVSVPTMVVLGSGGHTGEVRVLRACSLRGSGLIHDPSPFPFPSSPADA